VNWAEELRGWGDWCAKKQKNLGQVGVKPIPKLPPYTRYSPSRVHSHLSLSQMLEARSQKQKEEGSRKKEETRKKKEARLTRFSISKTDDHTQ
jgi:hypothetical protein